MKNIKSNSVNAPDYSAIAWLYDWLSGVVFGKKLLEARSHFLKRVLTCRHVLIVGGGSGYELEKMNEWNFSGKVTFVEPSSIIQQAKAKAGQMEVVFVQGYWPLKTGTEEYDAVITAFFLDQFSGEELKEMVFSLKKGLKKGGLWLNTDFVPSEKVFYKLFLSVMFLFFRVTAGLRNNVLEDYEKCFIKGGFRVQEKKGFGRQVYSMVVTF